MTEAAGLRLYLIRHPTPAVPPGVCYGRSDIDLAVDPADVARNLSVTLPPLDEVHSSPLRRCRRLAGLLHPSPVFDTRLQEMDFGAWEGRCWEDIERTQIDAWAAQPFDFSPPRGESGRLVASRVIEFAGQFTHRKNGGNIAVVSHQGPLGILLAHLLGEGESSWLAHRFSFGAVIELRARPDLPRRFERFTHRLNQDQA
jgi:alpha-ribazole phosphatase